MQGRHYSAASKTWILIAAVMICNITGNALLSRGMREVGEVMPGATTGYIRALLDPWVIGGIIVLSLWMISQLGLLSRADLSFVLPITAVNYVLIAVIGHVFLHEYNSGFRWVGIVLIAGGAALVGETSPRTTPEPPEEERL